MNLYKKFLRNFIFSALGISFVIVSFCILADPYEVWHVYSRQGFNLYSVKAKDVTRLNKPMNFIFHHKNAQALILGSSRPDIALDPKIYQSLTDNDTYNFSVLLEKVYESRRYLEHALANSSEIKEVIYCVDFFCFINNPQNQFTKFVAGFDVFEFS